MGRKNNRPKGKYPVDNVNKHAKTTAPIPTFRASVEEVYEKKPTWEEIAIMRAEQHDFFND